MVKRQLIVIAMFAFILNYAWEMLQMPFFEDMNYSDLSAWIFCFVATLGDVIMILLIFILGRQIFGKWDWITPVKFTRILYMALVGFSLAFFTEIVSLNLGLWRYSVLMPIIPLFNIGLTPVLQLLLLPYLSYVLAFKVAGVNSTHQNNVNLQKRSAQNA